MQNLCEGSINIKYDDEAFGGKITILSNEGEILGINLIAIQTEVNCDGASATWSALDLANPEVARSFAYRATFASVEDRIQFEEVFREVIIF